MKFSKILLFSILFTIAFSCSSDDEPISTGTPPSGTTDPTDPNDPNDNVLSISLSFLESSYFVGQEAYWIVRDQDNGTLNDAVLTVNGSVVTDNPYIFQSEGVYNFQATYQNITSQVVSFDVEQSNDYTKKVLLEDYTGTWCQYCPQAASAISARVNGSSIFSVGIHNNDTMQISEGLYWTNLYNVTGFPTVYVNGPARDWNYPSGPSINQELAEEATLGLSINSQRSGNQIDIQVSVGFKAEPNEDVKLMVLLVEGSVVTPNDPQAGAQNGSAYVHKDVLREVYTGQTGDVIPSASAVTGGVYTREFSNLIIPSSASDYDDLKIIAYVRNTRNAPVYYDIYNVQQADVGEFAAFD